jgi:hypothetical protein
MFLTTSIGPFLPAKRNRCPQSGHPATRFLLCKNLGAVWIGAYYVGTESGKKVDKTSFYFLSNKEFI